MAIVSCSSDTSDVAQCTVDIDNEVLRRLEEPPQRVAMRVFLATDGTITTVEQTESTNYRYEAWREWVMRNLDL